MVLDARLDCTPMYMACFFVFVGLLSQGFHISVLRIAQQDGFMVRVGMHGHLALGLGGRVFGFLCHYS